MAMFEQKGGKPYHRSMTGVALIAVGLAVFFALLAFFIHAFRVQLQWKDFQLQFAASIYDSGAEDGWMKADDTHEAVRVCQDNGQMILRIMQTAKAGSVGRVTNPQRQIWLSFSDGAHGILSEVDKGRTHVEFTGLDGVRYQIWLGASCKFEDMATLLSAEGAAYENELWEQEPSPTAE